jgi:hypothetical protein
MVISPLLRGLSGLEWDAKNRSLRLAPRLPANWERARLRNVPLGNAIVDLSYERQAGHWRERATPKAPQVFCLAPQATPEQPCRAAPAPVKEFFAPVKPVEIALPATLPEEGSDTRQFKILNETHSDHEATFTIQARARSSYELPVRLNRPHITVRGGQMSNGKLHIEFPESNADQTETVEFVW